MRRLTIFAVTLLAAGLLRAQPASVTTDEEKLRPQLEEFEKKFGDLWSIQYLEKDAGIATLTGKMTRPAVSSVVQEMLASTAKLNGANPADFAAPVETSFGTTRQYLFRQTYRDTPGASAKIVDNAFIVINVREGVPEGIYDVTVNVARRQDPFKRVRSAESAKRLAVNTLLYELSQDRVGDAVPALETFYATLESPQATIRETELAKADGQIERIYRVRVAAEAVVNGCRVKLAVREYDIDATTVSNDMDEAVVRKRNLLHRACRATARLFDPSPAIMPNRCSLTAGETARAFLSRDLELDPATTQGFALTSPFVRVCDVEGPTTNPPTLTVRRDNPIEFHQNSAGLAALMAYYHITELQHHVAGLGLKALVRQLSVDVDAQDESNDPYSAYLDDPQGAGPICFGKHSLRYLAEDAELIAHEYAHAVLFQTTKGRFGIIRDDGAAKDSEAGTVSEGFADYWALSTFLAQTVANGRPPECFAEWVNGGTCMRTAGAIFRYQDFNPSADDHINGQIWSGILLDILRSLGGDRATADRIILLGHLLRAFDGPAPTIHRMAEGILIADLKEFNGLHKKTLCSAFELHGVDDLKCCSEDCTATAIEAENMTQPVEPRPETLMCIPQSAQ